MMSTEALHAKLVPNPTDPYSLNRLAAMSGWPEASLRRLTQNDDRVAEILDMHDFRLAVAAARALKAGHSPYIIRALNFLPGPATTMWLISTPTSARAVSTMAQAMVWIENHPADSWHLSSLGTLLLGITGY